MANIFGDREVVRMRVKKCDGLMQPEYKKLCVDPQITSFDILRSLLATAFKIKSDFTISYLSKSENGEEVYLSMLSDWDLDAAFFGASDPQLRLKVDLKPFEESLDDWDIVPQENSHRLPKVLNTNFRDAGSLLGVTLGSITTQVNKTMSQVGKAIGFKSEDPDPYRLSKKPMADKEFHNFLDNVGHMVMPQQFRLSVYQGGVEHALRKVVWRHLLNVFPEGMTGKERFEYLKRKSSEYYRLRDEWRTLFQRNIETDEIRFVTNLVKKDVLRTDRSHGFFAGSDDSQNVVSLFNMLVTYALTHPGISYCQGMSDLASPILVVQNDEAHAYICFCGLMKRLTPFFEMDGKAMMVRFQHLSLLLQHHDPVFHAYLKYYKADDMFFCYRWLLLELKREFPFNDALRMLEIMWSSLVPTPPALEVELADPMYYSQGFGRVPSSPTFSANPYMRLKSMRQHSATESTSSEVDKTDAESNVVPKVSRTLTPNEELTQFDPKDFEQLTVPQTTSLKSDCNKIEMSLSQVTSQATGGATKTNNTIKSLAEASGNCFKVCSTTSHDNSDTKQVVFPEKKLEAGGIQSQPGGGDFSNFVENHFTTETAKSISNSSHANPKSIPTSDDRKTILSTSPKRPSDLHVTERLPINASNETNSQTALVIDQNGVTETTLEISSCEEALDSTANPTVDFVSVDRKLPPLPPPLEFGHGNPFLMFLCLGLFLQHRDHIMKNKMDYNDLAMHLDKMVRKHGINKVLHQAQSMYASYLKQQAAKDMEDNEEDDLSV